MTDERIQNPYVDFDPDLDAGTEAVHRPEGPDGENAPAVTDERRGSTEPARDPRFLRGVERLPAGDEAAADRPAPEAPAPAPAAPPELAHDVLPFRRTAVKPRRKRRNPWLRMLRPLATALLVVGLPAALAGWVLTSPRFALADVRVAGTERVDATWVRGRLAPLHGRNLLELPLAEVEALLAGHPWIEGVAIRKQLPASLAVEVRERRPAVLVPAPASAAEEGAGRLWLADAAGRPIVPAPPGAEDEFVRVVPAPERGESAGPLAESVPGALSVAAELARSRPVWAAALDRLEALGGGEYRVVTKALPFPLLVREGQVEERTGYLAAALPALERAYGDLELADLRFSGRLVLRPNESVSTLRSDSISDATPAAREAGPAPREDETRREVG